MLKALHYQIMRINFIVVDKINSKTCCHAELGPLIGIIIFSFFVQAFELCFIMKKILHDLGNSYVGIQCRSFYCTWTDPQCFSVGHSDGIYNKPCCHEKSPSKSNEVISPEILKMRAALFCIFTYLDTKTLLRAAEVCRDWKFVARHPAVWTRVLLENARVSSKVQEAAWKQHVLELAVWYLLFMTKLSTDLRICLVVPEHIVPVVHPNALPHSAKPQTQTTGKEGNQGRLPEEHTVRLRHRRGYKRGKKLLFRWTGSLVPLLCLWCASL